MNTKNTALVSCGRLFAVAALVMAAAVTAHADYHSTVLADKPVAYYPINASTDPTGAIATDLSGNGNNGTYNGTDPEYNTVPGPTAYLANAMYFDGFTSYVDLSTGSNPGLLNFSGPISLEAWVQPANTTEGPANILAKGYESSLNSEITLRANAGTYFGGSYDGNSHGAGGGQQTTDWAYVVAAYNGTNWSLYVNAILVQSNPDTLGSLNFAAPWRIGTGTGDVGAGRYFSGNLCDVALYTNGLTAAQVLNHYYSAKVNAAAGISAPIIVKQPQPQLTYLGGSATFMVTAVSALPATNLWLKNGSPMTGQTNATLSLQNIKAGDVVDYRVIVGNANGITTSDAASLALFAPANLKWSATGESGVWDTSSTANWVNLADNSQVVFNAGDLVLFDDTVGTAATIVVSGTVAPSAMTVNTSTNVYTINGSGALNVAGSFIKRGSSTLNLNVPASFTGPVAVGGGTLVAGYYAFANAASITVTNGATLDFAGGPIPATTRVPAGGAGVGGAGALVNNSYELYGQVLNLTLVGDTTFGGGSRWDLGSGSTVTGPHKVTINRSSGVYGEWNSVTIAASVGNIEIASGKLGINHMGATFGNPAATVTVDGGAELDFWSDSGYAKNYHVLNNGALQILTGFSAFNGNVMLEDGAKFNSFYGSGSQYLNGTFLLNGVAHFVFGDANFVFTNVISGTGGFVWDAYNHQLVLQASNTYTGPTIIGGGGLQLALTGNGSIAHSALIFLGGATAANAAVDVSGRTDKTLTLASGQTLAGIGTINGSLTVAAGATLSPSGTNTTLGITAGANATGTIMATNAVVLNGTTVIKLNGSGVNDAINAGAGLTYGGTLNLVQISGTPPASGNSFQIFSAASYGGAFTSISPATPGPGLAWDLSQLNLGIVNVVASSGAGPVIDLTKVVGDNLIFSGTGGTAGGSYAVVTATNLTTPANGWTALMTNSFDAGGAFSVTNTIRTGSPQMFYRLKELP